MIDFKNLEITVARIYGNIFLVIVACCLSFFLFNESAAAQSLVAKKSKRKRAKVSRPADFDGAGLVQIEYGYDGNFNATDVPRDQTGTASVIFNATDADFSASLLVNGRQSARGFDAGAQAAVGLSRELHKRWSWEGEVFGETLDTDQPQGLFAQTGLTYQINARANIDVGARFGLSAAAPRAGFFGGITVDFANFYNRH